MMMPGFSGRIHPAGWPFIGLGIVLTLVFFSFSVSLGWIFAVLTGWCVYFFRDPDRVTPDNPQAVVSPADGIIQNISAAPLPAELGSSSETWTRISIFLNVFDVHVNRMPVSGVVEVNAYHPGQFLNASLDKASDLNERQSLLVKTEGGLAIGCVQIAGLIARRIVCQAPEGQRFQAGQRFGIIRFGSRVDVYVPESCVICAQIGQKSVGGETILAQLPASDH